jgi:hypothetical protein
MRPFNLPTSDRDRNMPPSHPFTPSGHYRSRPPNDTQLQGRMPSNPAYHNPSGRSTPPNTFGSMSHLHRSYSGGDNFYDSRSHYPGIQQMPTRGFPESQVHPPISSAPGRSMQDPMVSMSPAKYECDYCGKGFNRPSSLKVSIASKYSLIPHT